MPEWLALSPLAITLWIGGGLIFCYLGRSVAHAAIRVL